MMITNNLMVTGGLQAILFDAAGPGQVLPDGTTAAQSQIAGNTVVDDGWGASFNSMPQIAGQSGFRVCNNIAPILVAQTNHGTTQDHNFVLGQIIYYVQNVDGTFQTNPSYFGGNGWYGPTGSSTTQDANHTSQIIEDLGVSQATFYPSLRFGTIPAFAGPPFNGAMGSNGPAIGAPDCGTPNNILGQPRSTSQVTTVVTPPTPPVCTPSDVTNGPVETIVSCNYQPVSLPTTTVKTTAASTGIMPGAY
jgi:hypothetical protein